MEYKASTHGLKRIEDARKQKGWQRQDIRWWQSASVSISTLKRFRSGVAIGEVPFKSICEAVGIADWQKVAELPKPAVIHQQDWGNARSLNAAFYGRTDELQTLNNWVISDKCRLLAIRGLTGIGKTSLVRHLAESLKDRFEFVIWRSLYPNPFTLQELVDNLVSFLSNNEEVQNHSLNNFHSLNNLVNYFHDHRCLVILDDIQTILEAKQLSGKYQEQFKNYQSFFEQISQSHHSCLIVIGNEQPITISMLEERNDSVRSLTLNGLNKRDSLQLLENLSLTNLEGYDLLVKNYCGNPFFIKFISKKINSLSGGDISRYLNLKTNLIGGISEWLDSQFDRISFREEQILYWLAILRFPISFQGLVEKMQWDGTSEEVFKCLESSIDRSLIEKIESSSREFLYSLNPVLLKYVSMRLVDELVSEISNLIDTHKLDETSIFCTHSLFLVCGQEGINEARKRYVICPIKQRLINRYSSSEAVLSELNIVLNNHKLYRFKTGCVDENVYGLIHLLQPSTS